MNPTGPNQALQATSVGRIRPALAVDIARPAWLRFNRWPRTESNTMLRQTLRNEGASPVRAIYRWGMLTFILLLIGWAIRNEMEAVEFRWRHLGQQLVVPTMLLFNHLAFEFRWQGLLGFAMNVLAFAWLFIGGYIVLYVR